MNGMRPPSRWRRPAPLVLWLCLAVALTGCGQVATLLDRRPPQGILAYSANPAPAGDLLITAAFDEPLAAAPLVQVRRPGVAGLPPVPMNGAAQEWQHVYPVVPEGEMALLSDPLTVIVSGIADAAGNQAAALWDSSLFAHAPDPAFAAASLEDLHFTKHAEPVLHPGPAEAWDGGNLDSSDVLKVGDTYLLYYVATNGEGRRMSVGLTTSSDGLVWEKYPKPVITPGAPGTWNSGLVNHPSVLWDAGVYHMWVVGQPLDGDNYSFRFGHTTSVDGIHWEPPRPVFEHGPPGAWDEERIGGLDVVKNGDLYYLYYTATSLTPEFRRAIGCATSPDGEVWTRCEGNPLLVPAEGRAPFEGNEVEGPNVISVYGTWLLAYTGYGGPQGANFKIGLARSADGLRWERLDRTAVLDWGRPGSFDETGTGQPVLLIEGNQLWMWYTGHRQDGPNSIALAATILN